MFSPICAYPRICSAIGSAFYVALSVILLAALAVTNASAETLGFSTAQTSNYLLIGTGPRSTAYGVDVDNRALNGGIAITNANGDIELSNVAVTNTSGGFGIRTTQTTVSDVTNGISNSTFNASAFSAANGITLNQNFSQLNTDLAAAKAWIPTLAATQTLINDITSNTTIVLQEGLNVINLGKVGSDFKLDNATLNITKAAGVTDALAIFRIVDKSFLASNASILVDSAIGDHSVMFYSGIGNTQAFNFSNMLSVNTLGIQGASFWALGNNAEININNANGCTQLVAAKINLNNVDLTQCAFAPAVVPLPTAVWSGLALMSGIGITKFRRRRAPVA